MVNAAAHKHFQVETRAQNSLHSKQISGALGDVNANLQTQSNCARLRSPVDVSVWA